MRDACLNQGLGEHRRDRLGKTLETVDDRDQDIVDASGLELVDDLEPELCALGLLDPKTQDLFLAISVVSEGDIDRIAMWARNRSTVVGACSRMALAASADCRSI